MTSINIRSVLQDLPANAIEAVVASNFSNYLLEALGFQVHEIYPQYPTGNGPVDRAARKTKGQDVFLHSKSNPYLLVELKGRDVNLASGSPQYRSTVAQIKRYLLGSNCQSAQWGIITNSAHIQLFRKHGKVIYPATPCYALDLDNIDNKIAVIRHKIENPSRALTVANYNNKGGVGKTTTTVNLAGILTFLGKKVLVIDLDPNQQDLTHALKIPPSQGNVYQFLTQRHVPIESTLYPYKFSFPRQQRELEFDVIPADAEFSNVNDGAVLKLINRDGLYKKLESARQQYDYILIDSPPNWRIFSQLAVYAADVVFIPAKHNNIFSLQNAAIAIKSYLPEIQAEKQDGSPIALPIFFNGEKITDPQLALAQQTIRNLIVEVKKRERFDLTPYFFPKYTKANKNLYIAGVPSHASIAGAAFSQSPAVYRNKTVNEYYKALAKEYFLQ